MTSVRRNIVLAPTAAGKSHFAATHPFALDADVLYGPFWPRGTWWEDHIVAEFTYAGIKAATEALAAANPTLLILASNVLSYDHVLAVVIPPFVRHVANLRARLAESDSPNPKTWILIQEARANIAREASANQVPVVKTFEDALSLFTSTPPT
jgi:hypothetical protein